MSKKYLYYFSEGNDAFGGDKVTMKNILGGKGAGLADHHRGLHPVLRRWPPDQRRDHR